MVMQFNQKEKEILALMPIPFDYLGDISEDELSDLYEIVPDYMMEYTDYNDISAESPFMTCEDIITKLVKTMRPLGLL